jgi:hypothetical protein
MLDLPIRRRDERWAAEEMRFLHWSMPLCHCADPAVAPALLNQVTERLRGLVRAQVARAVSDVRARTETVEVDEPLLCLLDGATTTEMRAAITVATRGAGTAGVTLRVPKIHSCRSQARWAIMCFKSGVGCTEAAR